MTETQAKIKVLLVEDDVNLGFLMVDYLETNGCDVKLYIDGEAGFKGFQLSDFDICLIDVMLPKMDGFTLIKQIKLLDETMPVIIISARSMKEDKLKGFRIGIDDYITKPFDEEELICRIRAVLTRKIQGNGRHERIQIVYSIGCYEFDSEKQTLSAKGNIQRLTIKENTILKLICRSRNRLVRREEIMLSVWGTSDYFTGRSLDVFMSKIRRYLKEDPSIKITTVSAVGYILE